MPPSQGTLTSVLSNPAATNGDTEANAGVGFAIPIDEALEVARALVGRKPIKVPFLGAELDTDLSPEDIDRYRLGNRAGALVLRQSRIGAPVPVTVLRRGRQLVLRATPIDQPGR